MKLLTLTASVLLTAGLSGCVVAPGYDPGYGYEPSDVGYGLYGGYGPYGGYDGGRYRNDHHDDDDDEDEDHGKYRYGGFCRSGDWKKGRCGNGGAVVIDPGVRVRVPQIRVDPGSIEVR